MVKIQIVSDLHLEFERDFKKIIKPSAPILCMAGDICACGNLRDFEIFKSFLTYITPKFLYVLHVSGNHEYYTSGSSQIGMRNTIQMIDKEFKKLNKEFPNYIYLNCSVFEISVNGEKCGIIGASLWSEIAPTNYSIVQKNMNDYNNIYIMERTGKHRLFNVEDMQTLHKKHKNFIKKAVASFSKSSVPYLLITHHKPVGDTPENEKSIYTEAYETDITNIIKAPIKVCVHGHTHVKYDKTIKGIRYVSNPKGYIGQKTKFDDTFTINLSM
jgi:predicted phosphodiesterase